MVLSASATAAGLRAATASGTRSLVDWASGLTWERVPAKIRRRAALVFADDLAAMVGATEEPQVGDLQCSFEPSAKAEATVFRAGAPRLDRHAAAAANGIAACWAELDEGYRAAPCHAGAYSIPAAVAEAEAAGATMEQLLTALTAAYEICARFARAFPFAAMTVHPHGCFAPLGAAAAVAHLRALGANDYLRAVTAATSMAYAGPYNHAVEGALVRNAWTAAGAWTGMRAVDWAPHGIGGLAETPFDVFVVCLGARAEPAELDGDLGEDFAIAGGYHKLFACCQYAHSALEANLQLVAALEGPGEDAISEIVVETHPRGQTLTTVEPETVLAAKFSMPHALAASAVLRTASAAAFTEATLRDERIADLRRRVRISAFDPIAPWPRDRPARVIWRMRDGSTRTAICENARGGADQPFGEVELFAKISDLTARIFPAMAGELQRLVESPDEQAKCTVRKFVTTVTAR